ncbi:hypothetical protein [Nocardioides sp.]|uniref:hypothetical protein n=1 Tax=Nocardioides sp. TaxID=35761 RepID=UPI002ED679B2
MNLRPLLTLTTLGVSTLVCASVATAGAATTAASLDPERILDRNVSGATAVRALGNDLDVVAQRYDRTPAELATLLRTDSSLWVDPTGMLHVKEPLPTQPVESAATPEPGPFVNNKTFSLHSKLGAQRTIFLDFDGGAVSGTAWNDFYTIPTSSQPAFDLDGNPASWSQAEHDTIQSIFQRVAEDFRPFDVDVTTQDPGAAALDRSSAVDTQFGTRVLVTPSTDAATRICSNNCGGVAFVGVYNLVGSSYYHPAWVFPQLLANVDKYIAEAATHEAGHNLGLFHDGTSTVGYYTGHHNWAPIMGVGYDEPLVQWSSGEYADANSAQDDIAVMQSYELPLRTDDHGSSFATATAMGTARTAAGVIERRTDTDVLSFRRTCRGKTKITVKPFENSPNLDIRLRLHSAGLAPLGSNDPLSGQASFDVATGLKATVKRSLAARTYYLTVDGVGTLTPATGYSDYGSLGKYSLKISRCR